MELYQLYHREAFVRAVMMQTGCDAVDVGSGGRRVRGGLWRRALPGPPDTILRSIEQIERELAGDFGADEDE